MYHAFYYLSHSLLYLSSLLFFFNDPATTEIYTLSLHDALPISSLHCRCSRARATPRIRKRRARRRRRTGTPPSFNTRDRKSTRLNSSHVAISYAVFCLKKKKKNNKNWKLFKYRIYSHSYSVLMH